jgi:hypothetical protein
MDLNCLTDILLCSQGILPQDEKTLAYLFPLQKLPKGYLQMVVDKA